MFEQQRPNDIEALGKTIVEAYLGGIRWQRGPSLSISEDFFVADQFVVMFEENQISLESIGRLVRLESETCGSVAASLTTW